MAQLLVYTKFKQAFPGSAFVTDFGTKDLVTSFQTRPSPASTASVDRPSDQPPADPLPQGSARADTDGTGGPSLISGPNYLAVIGGTKFDTTALETWVKSLPQDTVIVTGDGRGAEKALRSLAEAHGLRIDVPLLLDIPNRLGVQIEAVMSMTQDSRSPVVLIGEGSRVDQAKRWLKRGKWGREAKEL